MKRTSVATTLCMIFAASPAAAQLALPGAVAPNPAGTVEKAPGLHKRHEAAPTYAPPGAATVTGRALLLNGANGLLQLSARAGALRIDRFTMVGEVISDSTQQCRIDVGGGATIETRSVGRPDGLLRFEADIPACPFEFDVLDGAVLVPAQLQACIFKEADCQASPSGLWGPAGASLATDAKPIEHARARAEAAMVANYRALDARLSDRTKADDLAREQNRFLSDREETCRDYSRETAHNFCATRLTEARAAFLKARMDEAPAAAGKSPGSGPHRRKPPH
jgi:hypothetical protein